MNKKQLKKHIQELENKLYNNEWLKDSYIHLNVELDKFRKILKEMGKN